MEVLRTHELQTYMCIIIRRTLQTWIKQWIDRNGQEMDTSQPGEQMVQTCVVISYKSKGSMSVKIINRGRWQETGKKA
jgi:hypothetical protein